MGTGVGFKQQIGISVQFIARNQRQWAAAGEFTLTLEPDGLLPANRETGDAKISAARIEEIYQIQDDRQIAQPG